MCNSAVNNPGMFKKRLFVLDFPDSTPHKFIKNILVSSLYYLNDNKILKTVSCFMPIFMTGAVLVSIIFLICRSQFA